MTLPEYRALVTYWRDYPPAHLLLRALVRYRPDSPEPADLSQLLVLAGTGGLVGGKPS